MEEKKKKVEAIFINAITQEISLIELKERGRYSEMYRLLSIPGLRPCSDINVVGLDQRRHYINVDGEGLLKDPEHFILWKGYGNALAGHGIIIRVDDEGETVSAELSVETVKRHIKFVRLKMHGFIQEAERMMIFDKPGIRHTIRPVLTERREPGTGKAIDLAEIAKHMGVPVETLKWTIPEGDGDLEREEPEDDEA
jgi:predicted GNAT family N-acyltransferase